MFEFPTTKPDVPPLHSDRGEPFGWCCGESRQVLLDVIEETKSKIIFEIGSFLGQSASFIMENSEAALYCIDHWKNSPEHRFMKLPKDMYSTFIVNVWEHRERIRPVKMDSIEGLNALKNAGIYPDFIYVDGGHDYDSVYSDVECCSKLFPQAVICGDDYTWSGVKEAVTDISNEFSLEVKAYNERAWRLK